MAKQNVTTLPLLPRIDKAKADDLMYIVRGVGDNRDVSATLKTVHDYSNEEAGRTDFVQHGFSYGDDKKLSVVIAKIPKADDNENGILSGTLSVAIGTNVENGAFALLSFNMRNSTSSFFLKSVTGVSSESLDISMYGDGSDYASSSEFYIVINCNAYCGSQSSKTVVIRAGWLSCYTNGDIIGKDGYWESVYTGGYAVNLNKVIITSENTGTYTDLNVSNNASVGGKLSVASKASAGSFETAGDVTATGKVSGGTGDFSDIKFGSFTLDSNGNINGPGANLGALKTTGGIDSNTVTAVDAMKAKYYKETGYKKQSGGTLTLQTEFSGSIEGQVVTVINTSSTSALTVTTNTYTSKTVNINAQCAMKFIAVSAGYNSNVYFPISSKY